MMIATRPVHLGLFLLSSAVLMLEVALTRVFSLMLYGHYAFLIISSAVLGFGAAGSWLAVERTERGGEQSRRYLSACTSLFALSLVLAVLAVTRLDVAPTRVFRDGPETLKFLALYAVTLVPFFFAGLAVCHLLSAACGQVNTIYFADLSGAGAGALIAPLLLNRLGAPVTIGFSCSLAVLAAWIFAGVEKTRPLQGSMVAAAVFLAVGTLLDAVPIPVAASKPMRGLEEAVELSRWSLHGRIDVMRSEPSPLSFGSGVNERHFDRPVEYRVLFVDGSNPSRLVRHNADPWFLRHLLTAGAYAVGAQRPRVVIVGSGGGIDTMMAIELGASDVTALEINPVTVDIVRNEFRDYLGGLFDRPDVHLLTREGRHFMTLDVGEFDLIRLTGVDTAAAAAVGANTLDHAYVYTVEAVRDYWNRLSEEGVLAVNRPRGWKTLRLVNVFLAALDELGVEDAAGRLAVVTNGRWCDVLLRKRPFTPVEVERLSAWAEETANGILYDPFHGRDPGLDRLIRGGPAERARIVEESEVDLRPVTDDAPYFFEPMTLGGAIAQLAVLDLKAHSGFPTLLILLVQAVVLSAVFILLPLWRGRDRRRPKPGKAPALGYFALLGLGFILAEIVFIQKYMIVLGGPVYAMSVTLFSILVFSGFGALAARWIPPARSRAPVGVAVVVAAALAMSVPLMNRIPSLLLEHGLGARVALSILSLAPVSFALGLPFPTGVRLLARRAPELIPWAWAANACLTVVGSVLAAILSIEWGFSRVLLLAAACYGAAAVCGACMGRIGEGPGATCAPAQLPGASSSARL